MLHLKETLNFTDYKGDKAHVGLSRSPKPALNKRSPHWKLKDTFLKNKFYKKEIETIIKTHSDDLEIEERREVEHLWETMKTDIIHRTNTIGKYLARQEK